MISNKFRSVADWRALNNNPTTTHDIMDPMPTSPDNSSKQVSCHSIRVVTQPNRFMYL